MMSSKQIEERETFEINNKTFEKIPKKWEKKVNEEGLSDKFILINKYPKIWVYLGTHGDHLLISLEDSSIYCSCKGFRMSLEKKDKKGCSHIYALRIAYSHKKYRDISDKITFEELNKIIEEIMELDYSYLLRNILLIKSS